MGLPSVYQVEIGKKVCKLLDNFNRLISLCGHVPLTRTSLKMPIMHSGLHYAVFTVRK